MSYHNLRPRRGGSEPDRSPSLQPNTLIAERYIIERRIAVGGMGSVYAARQRPFMRRVALKVMHPELLHAPNLRERFHSEALVISRLAHPNTITIFDFGYSEQGQCFIAMEYVEGEPLSSLIDREAPLPASRATSIAIQIAQSLGEAHAKGIIHRDLKPENVMLQRNEGGTGDFVKVVDFGIARIVGHSTRVTQVGTVCGTPMYMSPEQGRGQEVDHRTDLYALGCCLFEMLTGLPPFDAKNSLELMMLHQHEPPPRLPGSLPSSLDRFIQRALAKHPGQRPQDASTFAAELTACFMGLSAPGMSAPGMSIPPHVHNSAPGLARSSDIRMMELPEPVESANPRSTSIGPPGTSHRIERVSAELPAPSGWGGLRSDEVRSVQATPNRALGPERLAQRTAPDASLGRPGATPLPAGVGGRPEVNSAPVAPVAPSGPVAPMTPSGPGAFARTLPATTTAPPDVGPASAPATERRERLPSWLLSAGVGVGFLVAAAVLLGVGSMEPKVLKLDSAPQGAIVTIDGEPRGVTPMTWEASGDEPLNVSFTLEGHRAVNMTRVLPEESRWSLFAPLKPLEMSLTLRVPMDGAQVRVGALDLGALPSQRPRKVVVSWPSEPLVIEVRHPRHETLRYTITPEMAREELSLSFNADDFVPRL